MSQKTPTGFIDGDKISEVRRKKGLSRTDLAHYTGVDVGTISRIENTRHKGFNVGSYTLFKIAAFLDVSVYEFINRSTIVFG